MMRGRVEGDHAWSPLSARGRCWVVVLAALFGTHVPALRAETLAEQTERLRQEILEPRFQADRSARVENLVLERDRTRITLTGDLLIDQPIDGVHHWAWFVGEGRLEVRPPIELERQQVRRFLGTDSVDLSFWSASIFSEDARETELFEQLRQQAQPFDCEPHGARACERLKELRTRESEDNPIFHARDLTLRHLDPRPEGNLDVWMRLEEATDRSEVATTPVRAHVGHDPHAFHQNRFNLAWEYSEITWSTVARYADSRDYRGRHAWAGTSKTLEDRCTQEAAALSVRLILKLQPERIRDTEMDATLIVIPLTRPLDIVRLSIPPSLQLLEARTGDQELDFLHVRRPTEVKTWSSQAAVALPTTLEVHEQLELKLRLAGNLLDQHGQLRFRDELDWYPRPLYDHGSPAVTAYDVTLLVPKDEFVLASGTITPCRDGDLIEGMECRRFAASRRLDRLSLVWFEKGYFTTVSGEGVPPIAAVVTPPWSEKRANDMAVMAAGVTVQQGEMFGPPPFPSLMLAPYYRGHGYGSSLILYPAAVPGLARPLIAHELAHQWWDGKVGTRSPLDAWINEGLAEFASLIALEFVDEHKQDDQAVDRLANIARALGDKDGYASSLVPLSLSDRFNSITNRSGSESFGQVFETAKGGFVFHMLRCHARYLKGDEKQGDELFRTTLRSYYDEHRRRRASNLDLMETFSTGYGEDLAWFFRQWVHGLGLPELELSQRHRKDESGQHFVDVRLRQVGQPFRFAIRSKVVTGKKANEEVRLGYHWVEDTDLLIELGPFDQKPRRVELNDDQGVLCTLKDVKRSDG